ncbi:methylated-DNA--[protein]-cysteine S-methyltransferase [Methanococcoides methylutens]|uniref:Methylated-DNA--protein-cysteine methyltransferase n=1 Tax=Methanococcoides methylutens MM1 TaxID=1434104 RepID=A0A0E3SS44_METMT|nr:methylated-DNA--[protein]-cysteine S-methyltransferase [Methanococcoides methylutens]AKB85263.1 Methylated-DNA--protein-cysteine methyltransferase [Methanococcoides methylutens MM1]
MKSIFFYETSIGKIGIAEEGNAITNLYFHGEDVPEDAVVNETELLKEAGRQLQEYLAGERKEFDLPLSPVGTEFMQRVWDALCEIPYGETRCYQEIAQRIGNPKASRAVGLANNRNPIPIYIPCHRIIGKNGKLTGFRSGLGLKERLLELEEQHKDL